MRALVQRVSRAEVKIADESVGSIGAGLVILLGVTHADTEKEMRFVADKCVNLRIFADEKGLMNRSALQDRKEILVVSQFTLYGDASHGRRPSFTMAARPEKAEPLYEAFVAQLRSVGLKVATGRFGADMLVSLENDGPVTLMVESAE